MFRTLSAALILAVSITAQLQTSVTGVVRAAPPAGCSTSATHVLQCSNLQLVSNVVDLNQFVGSNRKLTGTLDLSNLSCIVLEVTETEAAGGTTSTFSFQNYRIGSSLILTTLAPIGNTLATLLAFDEGFFPLGSFGSVLLDPTTASLYSIDFSIGISIKNIPIPNDPNLIGCSPVFQVLSVDLLNPAASELYNPACFTIN